MAKKKRRRPRTRAPRPQAERAEQTGQESSQVRRERKERARRVQEQARRRARRTSVGRRAVIFGAVGLLAIGYVWLRGRAPGPRPLPQAAVAAAQAAGCTGIRTPTTDPARGHLAPGQTTTYSQHPATSGIHNPTPLPTSPAVYTQPVDETEAVHFLEHAGIILYYRQGGADALASDVVGALAGVANAQPNTLLIPYPDLPVGTSLALATWNKLQTCPAVVTASQATTIANGFVHAYVCTSNAPEPKISPDC
jgi:Protein of unknown function (DUF3105)